MENYQTYFAAAAACSSSPTSSASLDMLQNINAQCQGNNRNKSSGFLGLLPEEMEVNPAYTAAASLQVNSSSTSIIINNNNNYSSYDHNKSFNMGSDENEEKSPSSNNKKKAEKKVRKPRYAFQTRSQVDILDDGYRWRKYGQKAVKNNKFPRSYYRCTHQGCNVKKQVQRLTKDEGVVVTTYEGMHSHPIEKTTDNFEHILSQMQVYTSY